MSTNSATPFYKQTWFLLVVAILVLLMILFGVLFAFLAMSAVEVVQKEAQKIALQSGDINVVVHGADKIEIRDQTVTLAQLAPAANNVKDMCAAFGLNASQCPVHIHVAGDIDSKIFKEIVFVFARTRLTNLQVQAADEHLLPLNLELLYGLSLENTHPPIVVQIDADPAGKIAKLRLGDQELPDLAAVQQKIHAMVGDSSAEPPQDNGYVLQLKASDDLRFEHLLAAWDACTSIKGTTRRDWLIGKVAITDEEVVSTRPRGPVVSISLIDRKRVYLDRKRLEPAELPNSLKLKCDELTKQGSDLANAEFFLTLHDDAPCGMLRDAVSECAKFKLSKIRLPLGTGEIPEFDLPLATPEAPLVKIFLQSDRKGNLTGVMVGEEMVTLDTLRSKIKSMVGPLPNPPSGNLVIVPDAPLQWKHLKAVWEQAVWDVDSDGKRTRMFNVVYPFEPEGMLQPSPKGP